MTLPSYQNASASQAKAPRKGGSTESRWRRLRRKFTVKRVVLTLLLLVLLAGGWLGGKFIYEAHKLFGGNIFSVLSTTKLKGEDTGRVNILLAGNSADDPGHQGADLTDSIMLVSIDTKDNKAFLLSIPRDLWVHIPGDGHEKINDAYVYGEQNGFNADGYPQGGMGQLEQIVSQDFDIPIDYYALVDYTALRDSVNDVGGIDINIQSSDPRGLYDPSIDYTTHGPLVKLTNGEHHLDGEQALDLARARGDAYGSYGFAASDFTRTQDQREMLIALKSKAVSVGVLANPVKLNDLMSAIGNNVTTDFNLSQVHRLYDLTKNMNNIQSLSLNQANGQNLLASYEAPDGESALIPAAGLDDYSAIQAYIRQLTSSNPVVQEGAKVVVLNGTGTNGVATQASRQLTNDGLDVTAVGNSPAPTQATPVIIDESAGKKPATKALLTKLYGNNFTTQNPYGLTYDADFIVILGTNQVSSSTPATGTAGG